MKVWMLNTGALEVSHKMHIDLHQVGGGGAGSVGGMKVWLGNTRVPEVSHKKRFDLREVRGGGGR